MNWLKSQENNPTSNRLIQSIYRVVTWKQVVAHGAILSAMKVPVGVASSHDHRGKMPLPQEKTRLQWKVTTCAIIITL